MTVQELIDKLQQVEDKSATVVTINYEIGYYINFSVICATTIPATFNISDDYKESIPRIKAVIL